MPKGNPNPSPSTRFGAENGNPINRSGRSSEELKNMHEAAKIASKLTLDALSSLQELTDGMKDTPERVKVLLQNEVRQMIKEAQDRAHGTPKQSIDHTTAGEPINEIRNTIVRPDGKKD